MNDDEIAPLNTPANPFQPKEKRRQLPLKLRPRGKTEVRTQFCALCYLFEEENLRICLVTSRRSRRWILPKGWPMHNQTPAEAAATEAWEEAGVTGHAFDQCLGVYSYVKPLSTTDTPVVVMVYPLRVAKVHDVWPEAKERKRKWMEPAKAAKRIREPGLQRILKTFDPGLLHG